MVGAASIMCVLNVCDGIEVPLSFGGDGGLIAVPPALADRAQHELQKLQAGCVAMFGLQLRAAAFKVHELRAVGEDILVRKFRLNADNHLAMFSGNGTALADEWLKSDYPEHEKYRLKDVGLDKPDLEGLSCRWEPLQSMNGVMLTLIIKPVDGKMTDIAGQISRVLDQPLAQLAPVKQGTLRFRFPPRGMKLEVAATARHGRIALRYGRVLFTATMQYLCEKFGIKIGDYNGQSYRDELISSTDFRKYDGALRMVLDVSSEQAQNLEQWLESEFERNHLIYGSWRSSSALMTCMLFDLSQARHLHLIDGAGGGYTLAAKAYKQRLSLFQEEGVAKASPFGKGGSFFFTFTTPSGIGGMVKLYSGSGISPMSVGIL
jgi:hypothetical protein